MQTTLFVLYDTNGEILDLSEDFLVSQGKADFIAISDSELIQDLKSNPSKFQIKNHKVIKKDLPIQDLRIGIISPYGINCGIATYTKYLADEIRLQVKELKIFSENDDEFNLEQDLKDNVIRCWDRGGSFQKLIKEIELYRPDILFVQHEYGSFNNGARWNALMGHLAQWRTIVVLHSVYEHPDKLIFEAPCSEIIVHSLEGRELLKKRGINHCPIHYIPHGCLPFQEMDIKYTKVGSEHILFQYGFGFEYKGWDNAINITEKLKETYPDIIYIGIFNVSKFSEEFNIQYYNKLMAEVRSRNLQDNFTLHLGFRSEDVLLSYMKQAKVCLFPYWNHPHWKVRGASGAVRLALASGTPVVLGDVPFFDEFKGTVPVCENIEDYVDTISNIFEDEDYKNEIIDKTYNFVANRTWDKIAKYYISCKKSEEFTFHEQL